ncbi:hypothetical protein Bbelb_005710 [Branchiostoma belcheri]|nr:hypothetical protein Bbelb_005710 [Branchiostoma belcheri]
MADLKEANELCETDNWNPGNVHILEIKEHRPNGNGIPQEIRCDAWSVSVTLCQHGSSLMEQKEDTRRFRRVKLPLLPSGLSEGPHFELEAVCCLRYHHLSSPPPHRDSPDTYPADRGSINNANGGFTISVSKQKFRRLKTSCDTTQGLQRRLNASPVGSHKGAAVCLRVCAGRRKGADTGCQAARELCEGHHGVSTRPRSYNRPFASGRNGSEAQSDLQQLESVIRGVRWCFPLHVSFQEGVPRERSLFHSRRRGVFGIASGESLIIQAHELLHPVLTRASGGAVSGTDAGIATVPIAEEIRVSYAEDSRTSTTGLCNIRKIAGHRCSPHGRPRQQDRPWSDEI